jgi:hypothetical protein
MKGHKKATQQRFDACDAFDSESSEIGIMGTEDVIVVPTRYKRPSE